MRKDFRFSPIKTREELMSAIRHVHFACFKLSKKVFGKYLPVSGNLGIFTHFQDEFEFLTKVREELTDKNINWNQKYYLLNKPMTIPEMGDIPETTYTYLYIRRPDVEKPQVGDIDLVLEKDRFDELKKSVQEKSEISGVELFYRSDLDMFQLFSPDVDAIPLITKEYMSEIIKI